MTLYREHSHDWLKALVDVLTSEIADVAAVVVQKRYQKNSPSYVLYGTLPEEVNARENGLVYRLNFSGAQNIGFFPDMGMARAYVRAQAEGKRVLNLFAYTCSFSVAAVAGHAAQVVNLDMSRNCLNYGRLNHQLNQLDLRRVSFLSFELFRSFSKLKKLAPFDLIICDPPGEQGGSFRPARDWPRLANRLPPLLTPRGQLMLCASSPHLSSAYLDRLLTEACPEMILKQTLTAAECYPERDADRGCRALIYQLGN